jgi:acyl transferase domain-containing protein
VALPTYPFERKRYWIDPPKIEAAGKSPQSPLDALARPAEATPQLPQSFAVNPATENSRADEPTRFASLFERVMSQQLQVMARQLEVLTDCEVSDEDSTSSLLIIDDPQDGRRSENFGNGHKPEVGASIEGEPTAIK